MATIASSAFQLKGSMMTLTVMHLVNPNVAAIDKQLGRTITETPDLFRNMPVVIDISKLNELEEQIDFNELCATLREYGLIPVGVCNASDKHQTAARMAGLGSLSGPKKSSATSKTSSATKATKKADALTPTMLVTQPVRSGQRIYAKNTDLIIQGSVSNGAEIIADGNIHVYGTLRGRAIAGAQGHQDARIFCKSLQAELISIAGNYKLNDAIDVDPANGPFMIYLEEGQLEISPMYKVDN